MHLNEDHNINYSIQGKRKYLWISILLAPIIMLLIYVLGFYTVKFANTYKPLFKIGVNEELKQKDYSWQRLLLVSEGFELLYGDFGNNMNVSLKIEKDNPFGLDPMVFTCDPKEDGVHQISLQTLLEDTRTDYVEMSTDYIKENYLSLDLFKSGDLSVDTVKWNKAPNPFGNNDNFQMNASLKSNKENLTLDLKCINKQIPLEIVSIESFIEYGKVALEDGMILEFKNPSSEKTIKSTLLVR